MIRRRKDYHKASPHRHASKIYIICEGSVSEVKYFNFFEGLSSNLKIIIVPPSNHATDPIKLLKQAEDLFIGDDWRYSMDYSQRDQVWFAIDTDTWEKEGKIEPLRKFCLENNRKLSRDFDEIKPYDAWQVAQCNPSFEIWLYYHLYDSIPDEEAVRKRETFKKFVDEKFSGGLISRRILSGLKMPFIMLKRISIVMKMVNSPYSPLKNIGWEKKSYLM